jgi:hypothetical protein
MNFKTKNTADNQELTLGSKEIGNSRNLQSKPPK